jgi:hypothetical protein
MCVHMMPLGFVLDIHGHATYFCASGVWHSSVVLLIVSCQSFLLPAMSTRMKNLHSCAGGEKCGYQLVQETPGGSALPAL